MIFLLMLLLIVILTLGRGGEVRRYEVPPGEDVFAVVEGTWDWHMRDDVCRGNPHTISFSAKLDSMILRFRHPIDSTTGEREARYEIRDVTASHIRGFMEGETRKTAAASACAARA